LLRNKEIKLYITLLASVTIVGFVACYFFNPVSGIIALLALLLMGAVSFMFTRWRYRQIERLTEYLKRIAGGEYSLDIRDNDEGELSILKSELYKVTVTLSSKTLEKRQALSCRFNLRYFTSAENSYHLNVCYDRPD